MANAAGRASNIQPELVYFEPVQPVPNPYEPGVEFSSEKVAFFVKNNAYMILPATGPQKIYKFCVICAKEKNSWLNSSFPLTCEDHNNSDFELFTSLMNLPRSMRNVNQDPDATDEDKDPGNQAPRFNRAYDTNSTPCANFDEI